MNSENEIRLAAYREVLKDLEYQKKFLSNEENQGKTVQMSINRLKSKIQFIEDGGDSKKQNDLKNPNRNYYDFDSCEKL